MAKLTNAWHLFRSAWHVIRQDRELLLLSVMALGAHIVILAAFSGAALLLGIPLEGTSVFRLDTSIFMFVAGCAIAGNFMFFEGALIAGAYYRMAWGDPTLRSSLSDAWHRLPSLLGWTIINVSIGGILRAIQRRVPCPAALLTWIGAAAWSVATYLTVPAIIIDNLPAGRAVRRSAHLLKSTWGENVIAHTAFGLLAAAVIIPAMFLPMLLNGMFGAGGGLLGFILMTGVTIGAVLMLFVLNAYYKTALYLYAADEQVADGFRTADMAHWFVSK